MFRFVLLWILCVPTTLAFLACQRSTAWRKHSKILSLRASVPPSLIEDSTSGSSSDHDLLHLPPGRRTLKRFKFLSFLFDDSLKLLNPKTMGSYQALRREKYGDIFKTNIFGRPTVVCASAEMLKALGKEEGRTSSSKGMEQFFPPHHQKLFGPQSLLVQSGTTHSRLRQLIQPSLAPALMKSIYQPILEEAVHDFLADLHQTSLGGEIKDEFQPVVPHLRAFFISIALQILLGKSTEPPPGLAQDLTIWSKGLLAPPLTFIPWSTAGKAMRARQRIADTLLPLMEQERQNNKKDTSDNKNNSLLARLVSSVDDQGNTLSNQDILDNVLTLVFAGSDTTASAATSLWMTLSDNLSLKQKLQNDPALIPKAVQTVLESFPPAPFSMRLTNEPLVVQGYDIPAKWLVVYGFAGALVPSSNEKKFEPALEFMDRLKQLEIAETSTTPSSATSSVAFGTGPRMCPGRYLATLELEILCQNLLEYDWELEPEQNLQQTYTPGFFPKGGLKIRFNG